LIYGPKESGKTILLDKILIDLKESMDTKKKIPVLLNFEDICNKEIFQIIRQFLSIDKKELLELLDDYKILLLVDNIQFPDSGNGKSKAVRNLKKIINTINEYENIQIIASSNLELENAIPEDFLEYNHHFDFSLIFIHSLKTKQIKTLIKNWFRNKDVDFHDNIEKLLKNFRKFGLPRTPLSVTMFLWIIDKQEREPINNAVLVEIFIENLLEKANFENVFVQSFDFYNKKRLLSKLAIEMLENGDEERSYSLSYGGALNFVQKYLQNKYGSPQYILNSLIERKVLNLSEDNFVKFKTSFFFHYFLSLNINHKNPKFKEKVFNNLLEFCDEIDYYTGINRDDDEIFDKVMNLTKGCFQGLNEYIHLEPKNIDKSLSPGDSISKYIDLSKAPEKPTEERLDSARDESLSKMPIKKDVKKKDFSKKDAIYIDRVLKLAAIVLKNSEEIDDFSKRLKAYSYIIKSSISFLILYRHQLLTNKTFSEEAKANLPKNLNFPLFVKLLPIIHQVTIYDWLGTIKLEPVIRKKIELDVKSHDKISVYERFLSVFINSDVKASGSKKKIADFIESIDEEYLLDASFIKIITYYFIRSKDKDSDNFYLNLMFKIKKKLGQIPTNGKPKFKLKMKNQKQKRVL